MNRMRLVILFSAMMACILAARAAEPVQEAQPYHPAAPDQLQCITQDDKTLTEWKDITWPEKAGDADICLWKDDKYAAVSLTVDDNCASDHDWWLERCKKYDFRMTWFIIIYRIESKQSFFGTWEDFQKLIEAGMSVQSHTINHKANDNKRPEAEIRMEYGGSKAMIEEKLTGQSCLTLSYPRGRGNLDLAREYFIAARGTVGKPNIAHAIDYANTNASSISKDQINSILGLDDIEVSWLKRDMYKRGWVVALYHLVGGGKTDEERAKRYAAEDARLEYLNSKREKLWIDTFVDVAKYGQQRDTATLKTLAADTAQIRLSLTDKMRDDVFDYPLTVKVRLDDGWTGVKATQGEKTIPAEVVEHEGHHYALVQAVPDRGEIILQPGS